jgi:HEAT repeat protein
MKSARGSTLLQGALLAVTLLGLGYWAWQRYHHPAVPTYEGKTLPQWMAELDDPDYATSDRAADALEHLGDKAVPAVLDARENGDIRLHRRAAAVLVRIGAPAAPGLVAALKDNPKEQRIEVTLVRLGKAAVPALREVLSDEKQAESAAHVLGLIGPPAAEAVPDLIALLQRRSFPTAAREEAAFALGRIGEPNAEIVPALVVALKDGKMEVRRQGADALGWIGPAAGEAVPALVAALKDDEPEVAKKACQALSFVGEASATSALLEAFQSDRTEIVVAAGRALWRLGAKAEAVLPALLSLAQGPLDKTEGARNLLASFGPLTVPILMNALGDDEAARRETAAEVLGRIGPPARPAVPALIAALKDKSSSVSLISAIALAEIDPTRAGPAVSLLADALDTPSAVRALATIGPGASAAVPALIALLKPRKDAANENLLRAGAQMALARIGTPSVPALIQAIKDKKEGVAPLSGEAIGWILPPPKEAIPVLRQAIGADRAHAGVYIRALGRLAPVAQAAVSDLTSLLNDGDLRSEAAVALVRIDSAQAEKVVPLLVKDFQEGDDKQRQRAANALSLLGSSARSAAPALVAALHDRTAAPAALVALQGIEGSAASSVAVLLKDANVDFRRLAVVLLARLGPGAKPALSAVIAALADADTTVRAGAALIVEHIGTDASAAVPALTANLQAHQKDVRYQSASALGSLGPVAKEASRPLLECLLDPDENVRYAATLALKRIDPHFKEAVPALRDALKDSSPKVRLAAIDSLSLIAPATVPDTIPILVTLSRKPYPLDVRFSAAEGLHDLHAAEQAKQAVPWLSMELSNVDPFSCLYAARVLARIDPDRAPKVVLALAAALRTPHAEARRAILKTLGEFGSKAREAIPEIEYLLQDSETGMREEAIRALRLIQPGRLKRIGMD